MTNSVGGSASDSMNVALSGSTTMNLAGSGTPIALITAPTGGGNKSLEVIRDGVFPPVNSTADNQQYDTYNGVGVRTEDWVGYSFAQVYQFDHVVFQEGKQFGSSGCFSMAGYPGRLTMIMAEDMSEFGIGAFDDDPARGWKEWAADVVLAGSLPCTHSHMLDVEHAPALAALLGTCLDATSCPAPDE